MLTESMINADEVGLLINRRPSSAYIYAKTGIIPTPTKVKIGNSRGKNHWHKGAILLCMPNIEKFQIKSGGDNRTHSGKGGKRKVKVDVSYRPPVTPMQLIVNNAFNLCL